MCGIAGCILNKSLDKKIIRKTLFLMNRRGPDHSDYTELKFNDKFIYLLHSRLSIIDLEKRSNQPFCIGSHTIVFNGEIYNYLELKQKLIKKGYLFKTESDTEVLLTAFIEYGEGFETHLEGMWAFAIYDDNQKKLYLSRDKFSEKPLYYKKNDDSFFFGSEIKFLKSLEQKNLDINYQTLKRYLVYGYRSIYKIRETYFKNILQLESGHSMQVDTKFQHNKNKYWTPNVQKIDSSFEEIVKTSKDLLLKSLEIRLRSDVPIAFNLSGGIDSSTLAILAKKIFNFKLNTYSIIDEDPRYNEEKNITKVVNQIGSNHTNINLKKNFSFYKLEELINYHDQPICTINYFAHSLLQEQISNDGFKISISGTGADEIFTGYYDHHLLYLYELQNHPNINIYEENWRKHVSHLVNNPILKNPYLFKTHGETFRDHIFEDDKFRILLNDKKFEEDISDNLYSNTSLLKNRMANELFDEVIPIILENEDLNAMFYSVENRSPFLDTKLVEYMQSIPDEYYIQDGYTKFILREITKDILNDDVRLDRNKKGFNASIESFINIKDPNNYDLLLKDSPIFELVDIKEFEKYLSNTTFELNSDKKFLFNFLNSKIFLEQNYF